MSRHVTLKQLKRARACSEYRLLFQGLFGKSGRVRITTDNVAALSSAFNLYWAADFLLTPRQRREYERQTRGAVLPHTTMLGQMEHTPENLRDGEDGREIRVALGVYANERYLRYVVAPAFVIAYNSPRK